MTGHDRFIGPIAEDIQKEFQLTFSDQGVYQLDGMALKAAQELDTCIEALNECIIGIDNDYKQCIIEMEQRLQDLEAN